MNETTRRMARLIDLSAVQATNTEEDVRHCAALASRYRIISVHVLPCWTRFLSTLLPERGQADVMIGGPVGFPGGGQTTDLKVQEVRQLIAEGAREVDIVVNIGKVLSGDYGYVREDLRRVVEAAAPVPAKVILETHYLNEQQIRRVCDIAVEVGMAWVKTSTGWRRPAPRWRKWRSSPISCAAASRSKGPAAFAIWTRCAHCIGWAYAALA